MKLKTFGVIMWLLLIGDELTTLWFLYLGGVEGNPWFSNMVTNNPLLAGIIKVVVQPLIIIGFFTYITNFGSRFPEELKRRFIKTVHTTEYVMLGMGSFAVVWNMIYVAGILVNVWSHL